MWQMPFYDIMLLYNTYSDYIDKENEKSEKEQSRYQEQYQEQQAEYNINKYKQNIPDVNSITRGMMNGSQFKMPKF